MATTGYIKLSRNLFKNPFWTEERQFSKCEAWIDLIQSARVEQSSVMINNKLIEVQRGQVPASIRYLAKRWSWGEQKVRTYLKLLIDCAMITQQQHRGETIITLVNYGTYNDKQHSNEVGNNTLITQGQHTDNTAITQRIRKEECKKCNNEKINCVCDKSPPKFSKNDFIKKFLEKGVEENILKDWIKVRISKKQVFTETALQRILKEIEKAEITANEAIKICAEKSWGSFEKEWYENLKQKNNIKVNAATISKHQQQFDHTNNLLELSANYFNSFTENE